MLKRPLFRLLFLIRFEAQLTKIRQMNGRGISVSARRRDDKVFDSKTDI
jgi:hypothetical protein